MGRLRINPVDGPITQKPESNDLLQPESSKTLPEPVKEVIEVIKEVPVEVVKEVIKEVPVEVVKEVIKEVKVEVPVEVIKLVTKEVKVEVPVEKEVIKEVEVKVPVEVVRLVFKTPIWAKWASLIAVLEAITLLILLGN